MNALIKTSNARDQYELFLEGAIPLLQGPQPKQDSPWKTYALAAGGTAAVTATALALRKRIKDLERDLEIERAIRDYKIQEKARDVKQEVKQEVTAKVLADCKAFEKAGVDVYEKMEAMKKELEELEELRPLKDTFEKVIKGECIPQITELKAHKQSDLTQLTGILSGLQAKLAEVTKELEEKRKTFHDARDDKSAKVKELAGLTPQVQQLKKERDELATQIQTLEQNKKSVGEVVQKQREKVAEYNSDLKSLAEQTKQLVKEYKDNKVYTVESLTQDLENLNLGQDSTVDDLTRDLKYFKSVQKNLEDKLKYGSVQIEEKKKELQGYAERIPKLQEAFHKAEQEYNDFQGKLQEAGSEEQGLIKEIERLGRIAMDITDIDDLKEKKEELEKKVQGKDIKTLTQSVKFKSGLDKNLENYLGQMMFTFNKEALIDALENAEDNPESAVEVLQQIYRLYQIDKPLTKATAEASFLGKLKRAKESQGFTCEGMLQTLKNRSDFPLLKKCLEAANKMRILEAGVREGKKKSRLAIIGRLWDGDEEVKKEGKGLTAALKRYKTDKKYTMVNLGADLANIFIGKPKSKNELNTQKTLVQQLNIFLDTYDEPNIECNYLNKVIERMPGEGIIKTRLKTCQLQLYREIEALYSRMNHDLYTEINEEDKKQVDQRLQYIQGITDMNDKLEALRQFYGGLQTAVITRYAGLIVLLSDQIPKGEVKVEFSNEFARIKNITDTTEKLQRLRSLYTRLQEAVLDKDIGEYDSAIIEMFNKVNEKYRLRMVQQLKDIQAGTDKRIKLNSLQKYKDELQTVQIEALKEELKGADDVAQTNYKNFRTTIEQKDKEIKKLEGYVEDMLGRIKALKGQKEQLEVEPTMWGVDEVILLDDKQQAEKKEGGQQSTTSSKKRKLNDSSTT